MSVSYLYYPLIAVIAYLLGSLNFSLLVSMLLLKKDIRKYGSGSAGATNALRVLGRKWAVIVSAGDFLKAIAACFIGKGMIAGYYLAGFTMGDWLKDKDDAMLLGLAVAGLFCVIGHCYPLFFGFRGGKGVMVTGAVLFVLDWRVGLLCAVFFILVVLLTRYVSLGSMLTGVAAPLFMLALNDQWKVITVMTFLSIIAIANHSENIKRLIKGTENKISFKRKAKEEGEA